MLVSVPRWALSAVATAERHGRFVRRSRALAVQRGSSSHPRSPLARRADVLGFDEVSLPESRQHRSVFAAAAATLATTNAIRVRIGIANPVTRHPAVLAMEAAHAGRDRRARAPAVRRSAPPSGR